MPPFTNSLQKLQESLNDLKSEIDKYHCSKCGVGLESYEESNSATVAPSYKQLEDRILELQKECESLTSKNKEYKEKIADQNHTIDEQFKELDRLRDTCTELKQGSSNELEKTRTLSEQQAEISHLKEAAKAFAEEEQKLKREISDKDKNIERLNSTQKTNNEQYEKSIQRLEDENKRNKENLKRCQSEVDKLSAKLAEKVFLLFPKNHDQSYPSFNKMPAFSNSLQKLQESLNDLKSEIDKYHCPKCGVGLESYEESNSATVNPSYKQLEDRILELQNECESLTLKNNKNEEKIADQEHTIGEQFKELDRLRDTCTELKQGSSNELEKNTSEQQAEIFQLKEAAKAFAEEEQKLKRQISERDKNIEHLNSTQKANKEQYEKSIQQLEYENKRYKENLKRCQSEVDKFSAKLAEKDRINNNLVSRRLEIEEKCKQLECDLERKSRKEIAVGFHTTVAPSMSSLILGGLTSRLTDRLAGEKVDLVRQAYSGGPDVNFPLLVVCVNVSRIGADAKEALKGIPKAKDVALLVFHHKEAHALPSQTSDKILTGADFSGLGSIIDLAFLSQRGIYECDMNTVGIERVASFLLQYKTQRK